MRRASSLPLLAAERLPGRVRGGGVRLLGACLAIWALGMLSPEQAIRLKRSGLDYYNHNLDTSPEYYDSVVTTRTYQERLDTLQAVADDE